MESAGLFSLLSRIMGDENYNDCRGRHGTVSCLLNSRLNPNNPTEGVALKTLRVCGVVKSSQHEVLRITKSD